MKARPFAKEFLATLAYVALSLLLPCVAEEDPILAQKCTPEKFEMFPGGWPKVLDSHIYWFGLDNQVERATGNKSQFYDPTRKTIIFMDGFNGLYHVDSCHRMTSKCVPLARCESGSTYIANPWVEQGYNFGMFFWDQFADEDCYFAAELKVWGHKWGSGHKADEADQYLNWNSYDPVSKKKETRNYHGPETSVAQICASAVRSAMPSFSRGQSLQITGFSLGAQLAAACADRLYEERPPNHPAVPTLVALLEPAFTADVKPWSAMPFHPCSPIVEKKKETLKWTVAAVERLYWKHNVPMTLYKSSYMTRCCYAADMIFEPGTELDVLGTLVRWTPTFCGSVFNYPCQHDVIVPFYFFNMGETPLAIENQGPTSGSCKIPGPLCTDAEILDIVKQRRLGLANGEEHIWKQVLGLETWTVEDDVFRWDTSSDPPPPPPATSLRRYSLEGFVAGGVGKHLTVLSLVFVMLFLGCFTCAVMRQRSSHYTEVEEGEE